MAIGISTGVNIAILAVLLFFVGKKIIEEVNKRKNGDNIDVGVWQPKAPKAGDSNGGGGGGGDHTLIDPTKGHLPKIEKNPLYSAGADLR